MVCIQLPAPLSVEEFTPHKVQSSKPVQIRPYHFVSSSSQFVSGMQPRSSQCTGCSLFERRSVVYEEEYQHSPFFERLRTSNSPPTDQEDSFVQHAISSIVSDVSSIDSKMASLHNIIRAMNEERKRLVELHKKFINLVSLHRTLPPEIWSQIFYLSNFESNAFDASATIWRLSHVFQGWRNIALSLHSFWSTMDISFPDAAQHEADVQRLETVLQRSAQGPLDVSLTDHRPWIRGPVCNPSIQKRMLDIVLAESYRLRRFHISDFGGGLKMFCAELHNRLPRLESLGLFSVQLESKDLTVFNDCLCLTNLTLGEETVLGLQLPWDQITELDLSCLDLDTRIGGRQECLHLIRQCHSLEILSLPYWDSEDDDDGSVYMPIPCSEIRQLHATSVPVIDALTLPLLREASLHPSPATTHYSILNSFNQLLIRSNGMFALTALTLDNVPLGASPDNSLHYLLSQTHSLAFLDLTVTQEEFDDETDVSDEAQISATVQSLRIVPTGSVTFLPLLSALIIRVESRDPFKGQYFGPVGDFASMLKARWKGDKAVRLRKCHLTVHAWHDLAQYDLCWFDGTFVTDIFNEEERPILNALVDDGMDLVIRVTSTLTDKVGAHDVVFAVPSS